MKTTVSSEHSYCLGLLSAPQGEEASCVRVHVCVCAYVSVCTCAGDGTHRMSGLLCVCVRAHMCAGDGTHHACQGSSDVPRRAGGISHQGCGVPWRVSGLLMLGRFLPAPFTSPQRGLGPAGHQKPLVLQVRVFLASSSHCFSLLQHPTPLPSRRLSWALAGYPSFQRVPPLHPICNSTLPPRGLWTSAAEGREPRGHLQPGGPRGGLADSASPAVTPGADVGLGWWVSVGAWSQVCVVPGGPRVC